MLPTSLGLVVLVAIVLGSLLIYLGIVLRQTRQERDRLKQDLRKYDSLTSREETEKQIDANIYLKQAELQELDLQQQSTLAAIGALKSQLQALETKEYLISIDEYEPKYDFGNSEQYLQQLKDIQSEQQAMRSQDRAFICETKWSIGDGTEGKMKGKKMVENILRMIEIAFEEQCKYAIKKVSYNNLESLKKKINTTFSNINKYVKPLNCRVSEEYLDLKFSELELKCEYEDKLQQEKERNKAIQDQLKKEEKERLNLEKAQQEVEEAEQREKQYQEEIARIHREETQASGLQRQQYEQQLEQLEIQLALAQKDKEKALSSTAKLKSGHVYAISNIGSLGRDVYRIFMTKNSNPDIYVKTMSPYVPFPFDVHFKIWSEDASATIQHLHQRFNERRVNVENERREFFKVSFDEIKEAIQELERQTGTLTVLTAEKAPQAYEYRRTQAAERRKSEFTPDVTERGESA